MEQEQGFIDYIEQSIIKNWDVSILFSALTRMFPKPTFAP